MKRPNINLSVLATILVLFSGNAIGQAGGKESQKFEDYRDDAREALTDTKVQLESTVALYNALLNVEAEKPESTYKDLTSATKKSEKLWASYGKDEGKMQKQANKMFANWQEEINAYGNEQMKQLAAERLEVAKMDYDRMVERMKTTGSVSRSRFISPARARKHAGIGLRRHDLVRSVRRIQCRQGVDGFNHALESC